jgi:hypothetical protein
MQKEKVAGWSMASSFANSQLEVIRPVFERFLEAAAGSPAASPGDERGRTAVRCC